MKILLLVDHKKLGKKGEIVDVADGYALSTLIPSGVAQVATPGAVHKVERIEQNKQADTEKAQQNARSYQQKLKDQTITINAKANGEKLFGSITAKEVANAIKKEYNIDITEQNVAGNPIKTVGEHKVTLDFNFGITAHITVAVVAQ